MALDVGASLYLEGLVNDIANDLAGLADRYILGVDLALDPAGQLHGIAIDGAADLGAGADLDALGSDVALDSAVDLDVALAFEVAGHGKCGADHRGR